MSNLTDRPLALVLALTLGTISGTDATAAEAVADPALIDHSRFVFEGITTILTLAVQAMPEETYGFKPTDEVRSFGEIVSHVADSQYAFCSIVRGEDGPDREAPDTASRAALLEALEAAFGYCREAYEGLTGRSALEPVTFQSVPTPRLGVLNVNQVHTIEHYGNLVTYLRLNGIVPPTSDPEVMKKLQSR